MIFLSNAQTMTLTLVDLPRSNWRILPPRKWQVYLTILVILTITLTWSLSPSRSKTLAENPGRKPRLKTMVAFLTGKTGRLLCQKDF